MGFLKNSKGWLVKIIFFVLFLATVVLIIISTRSGLDVSGKNTFGSRSFFEQFIAAGGPIVWLVLMPMSVTMASLVIEHSLSIRRKKILPCRIGQRIVELIRKTGPGETAAQIADNEDMVSVAVAKAVTNGKGDLFKMRSLLDESLQDQALALLRKIEWINLIGNVSPMVGLFGTVYGMIKLFNAIVISGGQPQPAQLAEGISVALVTTFWGLFIAIPALTIYGIFRNRIETLVSEAVVETENIIPEIRLSIKKQNSQMSTER